MVFAEKLNFESSIERKLTLQNVVILSLSAMVGSGLFVLPALAGKEPLRLGNMSGSTPGHGWPTWCPHSLSYRVLYRNPSSRLRCPLRRCVFYIERTFGPCSEPWLEGSDCGPHSS